jgi:hypothetical protein
MIRRARRFPPRPLAGALLYAAALTSCGSSRSGLEITVDPAAFGDRIATLEVVVAVTGGFADQPAGTVDGVGYEVADRTGDGEAELLVRFNGPFGGPFSFRVETKNMETLDADATARAFDGTMDMFAGGSGHAQLGPGGKGSLAITLGDQTSPIGADTRTTDLKTVPADVTMVSSGKPPHLSTVAVCDVNGDGKGDVVIGAPSADPGLGIGATGAVFVAMGGQSVRATIDVEAPGAQDLRIFGVTSGDQLGTAVACADVDADGADELFVGAPGANTTGDDDAGKVYMLRGRANFASAPVDLASPTAGAAVEWRGAPGSQLGGALVVDVSGRATLVAAARKALQVHVLAVPGLTAAPQTVDAAALEHPRIDGVDPTALAVGDFNGDGAAPGRAPVDVVLGDAQYRAPGDGADRRGAVYVFSAVDPTAARTAPVATADVMIPGPEVGSQFGAAAVALDSGRGQDLLLGAPGTGDGAGQIYLFKNGSDFFEVGLRSTTETSVLRLPPPEAGGRFGAALAVARSGATGMGSARLVVGAPAVTRADRDRAGAAYLYATNLDRQFRLREQLYGAASNGLLGPAVAGGPVDPADTIGDLVAVAPEMPNPGGMPGAGAVYVRFSTP